MLTNVSVIIPAYNAAKTIGRCLSALQNQDYQNSYEIIVVDDGSSDDTSVIIRNFSKVIYLRQANAGPAAARNAGARAASGDVLLFTDSDCVPRPNWISTMLKPFANASIRVVAGSYGIVNVESTLARCIYNEIRYRHVILMPEFVRVFGSYNVAISREVFISVGGFNETYRNASGEDNDLSYKIVEKGWKIYFAKDALVDHMHTSSVGKYLSEQFRHGFWRVKMYDEHFLMRNGDGYTFWKDIFEIPIALLITFFIIGAALGFNNFKLFFVGSAALLLLIEIYFSFLMSKNVSEKLLFSFVMFLRSFARAFGFSTGFFVFFNKKCQKKLNKPCTSKGLC